MSIFKFRFGKSKPEDSPGVGKDPASENNKDEKTKDPVKDALKKPEKKSNMADQMKKIIKKKPIAFAPAGGGSLMRTVMVMLTVLICVVALLFMLGPKYAPEFMDKIGATKIVEKIPFLRQEPEEDLLIPEEEVVEELVTVRTYRVIRGDFVDILPGMGTIKGDREVELRFSVNGVIDSINFFEGDLLRKGDIVATLDQKDALLKLEYSKTKYRTQQISGEASKKRLEMNQTLFADGIIIKPKLDEVQFEYESVKSQTKSAQKEVEFALAELDKTYLYSPLDSVMGTRDVEVGEFVTSNVKVASLTRQLPW